MSIRIEQISKSFGNFTALHPVDLTLPQGDLIGLLGPSGSGKTTLLRILAGLESADQGRIWFGDNEVTHQHVRERKIGFVFQHYALFRHMTVANNVAFGLQVLPKNQRPSKAAIQTQVNELLDKVQLSHLAKRYPQQLSGGQQQRVALARALAMQPQVLLLDEPFGALDTQVRQELRRWLRNLHEEMGCTSIFVTHDQEEALEISDQVVVMSQGRIEQQASPQDLYHQPASRFVYDFLGGVNVFNATADTTTSANTLLRQGAAWLALPNQQLQGQQISKGQVYLRNHALELTPQPSAYAHLPFKITALRLAGPQVKVELEAQGWDTAQPWEANISHSQYAAWQLTKGSSCFAQPLIGKLFTDTASYDLNWHSE